MRRYWNTLLAAAVLMVTALQPAMATPADSPAADPAAATGAAAEPAPASAPGPGSELDGQITGRAGQPLAGAEVELFQLGLGRIATVITDSEGYFRFVGLDDTGAYWLRGWAAGYRVADANWAPGIGTAFLSLTPDPLTATMLTQVQDARTGMPIHAANVELLRVGLGRTDATTTGPGGSARLQGTAGAGYTLRVRAEGFTPVVLPLADLAADATRTVTVGLHAATGRVTGRTVTMPGGAALAGATLQAVRTGYGVVATATTGRDGSFGLELPAGAEYILQARASGHTGAATQAFRLAAGTTVDFSGEERLQLPVATATLTGRLLDPDGKAVVGRAVWLQRRPFGTVAEAETDATGAFRFEGVPARSGLQYRVQVLPGGPGNEHLWRAIASTWTELAPGQLAEVLLQVVKGAEMAVFGEGHITGTVLDTTGRPLSGARVELWREGKGRLGQPVTTGADGTFRFERLPANRGPGMGPGAAMNGYVIVVDGNSLFTSTLAADAPIDVQKNRDTLVSVTAYPKWAPVSGRAVDQDGMPLAEVTVRLTPESTAAGVSATTDAGGRWQLPQANVLDVYQLSATRTGYRAAVAANLVPDPAGAGARDLVLQKRTATLAGRVTDALGNPLPGAEVTAWNPTGNQVTASSDGDGRYRMEVFSGLTYLLTTTTAGHSPSGLGPVGSGPIIGAGAGATVGAVALQTPAPGSHTESDLRLWPAAGKVMGMVFGPRGRPAPGVAVELLREGAGVVQRSETDAGGRYRFTAVSAEERYAVRTAGQAYRYASSVALPPLFSLSAGGVQSVNLLLMATRP